MPRRLVFSIVLPWGQRLEKEVSDFSEISRLKELVKRAFHAAWDSSSQAWVIRGVRDVSAARELEKEFGNEFVDRIITEVAEAGRALAQLLQDVVGEPVIIFFEGYIPDKRLWRAIRNASAEAKNRGLPPYLPSLVEKLREQGKAPPLGELIAKLGPRKGLIITEAMDSLNVLPVSALFAATNMEPKQLASALASNLQLLWPRTSDELERILEGRRPRPRALVKAELLPSGAARIVVEAPNSDVAWELARRAREEIARIPINVQTKEGLVQRRIRVGRATVVNNRVLEITIPPALVHYALSNLERWLGDMGVETSVEFPKPQFERVELRPSLPPLWEHQREALEKWMERKWGTIVLPTGSGKTMIALAAIERLRVPTIVLVHTKALLQQWAENIRKRLGVEPGIIAEGKVEIKPITVALYQSLASKPELVKKIWNRFGLAIFDEVHHVPAKTFFEVARSLAVPYKMGLSATPQRADKNEHLIYIAIGEPVYQATFADMVRRGIIAPIVVEKVPVDLAPEVEKFVSEEKERMIRNRWDESVQSSARTRIRYAVLRNPAKIPKIVEIVRNVLTENPRSKIIVFTNFIDQADSIAGELEKEIPKIRGKVAVYHSKRRNRDQELERFRKGEARVLVVTQSGDEGIDIPEADVGIIASGYKIERQLVQRMGRLVRKGSNPYKVARLYIVYSEHPVEWRLAEAIEHAINVVAPQDLMRSIAEELRRRAEAERKSVAEVKKPEEKKVEEPRKEEIKSPATQQVSQVSQQKQPIRRNPIPQRSVHGTVPWSVIEHVMSMLSPPVQELIKRALRTPPSKLSEAEKRALILLEILVRGQGFMVDEAFRSSHRAYSVYSWIRNPAGRDLPGVDTPDAKRLAREIWRALKRGGIRAAEQIVLAPLASGSKKRAKRSR